MSRLRAVAAMAVPDRAPEVCLGDSANYPVDPWAYGCILEELAHKKISCSGHLDFYVIEGIFRRFGTPDKPHPLRTLWDTHTNRSPVFGGIAVSNVLIPNAQTQSKADAVPLVVAGVSSPDRFRALVHGLLQLAPDDRMTCRAAVIHPSLWE